MTQPPFTANTTVRNQGRRGHFGMALQDVPGTYKPPTNFLRETAGSGFLPDDLERVSQAFRGTSFESPAEYAGSDYQGRSVTGEATAADIILALKAIYGQTPAVDGIITPNDQTQWADFFPAWCMSGQWYVPGAGHVQITDGQAHELTLTVPEQRTEYVSAALAFHARAGLLHPEGTPITPFVPAVPVIPSFTGAFGRLDHSTKINGVAYCPDGASTARFFNPIDPLPACGPYVKGFAPSDQPMGVEFTMGWGKPMPEILEAAKTKAFLDYVWRLASGGPADGSAPTKLIEVTARVQVTAREVPVGPGRVRTTATFRARCETPGVAPFSIKTANT